MNKLMYIYLLSLIILYAQCAKACNEIILGSAADQETAQEGGGDQETPQEGGGDQETPQEGDGDRRRLETCDDAQSVEFYKCVAGSNNKCELKSLCDLETNSEKCESTQVPSGNKCSKKEGGGCQLVSTATNSSNILNIFKVTFILLFIFTVL